MTILIVGRHGNTFETGETPRRVGRRTDLPLTAAGAAQARALGVALRAQGLIPDSAWCGTLRRTRETARLALAAMDADCPLGEMMLLDEIDYGPDEDQPETSVMARLGEDSLKRWEDAAVPPPGWLVDPLSLMSGWQDFAAGLGVGTITLAVTSNGIARFAPSIAGDLAAFGKHRPLKLATGTYGVLRKDFDGWTVTAWNVRP